MSIIDGFFDWLKTPSESITALSSHPAPIVPKVIGHLGPPDKNGLREVIGVSATLKQTQQKLRLAIELAEKLGERLAKKDEEVKKAQDCAEALARDRSAMLKCITRVNELLHSDKGVALKALPQRRVQEIRKAVKAAFAASANHPY